VCGWVGGWYGLPGHDHGATQTRSPAPLPRARGGGRGGRGGGGSGGSSGSGDAGVASPGRQVATTSFTKDGNVETFKRQAQPRLHHPA
jgi:hypothetical protein